MSDNDNIDRSLMMRMACRDVEKMLDDISAVAKMNGHPDPVMRNNNYTMSYDVANTQEFDWRSMRDGFERMFAPPIPPKPEVVVSNKHIKTEKSKARLVLIVNNENNIDL